MYAVQQIKVSLHMIVPAKLIELLDELIPAFAGEKYKNSLAEMLWMTVARENDHRYYENSLALHSKELAKMFGKASNFSDANRSYAGRYFHVHRFSNFNGNPEIDYTNGYEPRPWMRAVLDGYLEENTGAEFRDGRGQRHKPSLAIRTTDSSGNRIRRWQGVEVQNLIPTNLANLRLMAERFGLMMQASKQGQLTGRYKSAYGANRSQLQGHLDDTQTLIRQAEHFGGLPIQYVQSYTGRLYATGVNLQGCKRQIRHAALAGCYDYDIAACHFSILTQMAAKFGLKCSAIDAYVSNKAKIRLELSSLLGVETDKVKRVLTAMAYGARRSLNPLDAIPRELGPEASALFYGLDHYKDLKNDIGKATVKILKEHPLVKKKLVNAVGKELIVRNGNRKLALNKIKRHTKMSHLMQGVEAAVLEVAARTFNGKIVLLQHDGFTTTAPIDLAVLHDAVARQTGYELKFEEDLISMPDPDFDVEFFGMKTKFNKPEKVNVYAGLEVFWGGLLRTVGYGLDDLPPPHPIPLPNIQTPF
jgi:hypothetical protein